ncbi:MAG: 4-hydroxy-tetrahydrodipicolinate reductase [Elusimicrobia bacterium]|nr:4-hydroxy-tetrahydrodipicolinate reductase [Elusimicrobiota bacterium]
MPALRIVVCGVLGRMGARVAALAEADKRFRVVAGVAARASHVELRFPLVAEGELRSRMGDADMLIDFSSAQASVRYAELAARTSTPLVVGTTGRTPAQDEALKAAAKRAPLFVAANFSPGIALLRELARRAAGALPSWDAAILDVHHKAKKDAPSGTAKVLAEAVRGAAAKAPQLASLRAGDVVGDHTIVLAGPDERLELSHRAHSRDVFARGALEAAYWLRGRKPALYGMADLLRLET